MKSITFFDDNYPVKTLYTDKNDGRLPDGCGMKAPVKKMSIIVRDRSKYDDNSVLHVNNSDAAGGEIKVELCAHLKKEILEEMIVFTDVPVDRIFEAEETHSGNVLVIDQDSPSGRLEYVDETYSIGRAGGFDSIITSLPGILIFVRTADCTPVFLYDRVRHVIAIVHSGWRSTLSGITVNTVRTMERCFHSKPEDILVAIGPCICGDCYEVGEDLKELFEKKYSPDEIKSYFKPYKEGKYLLDVKEIVRTDLILRGGIKPANMYDTGICSYESEMYASFRRKRKRDLGGQTVSGIVLT